MPILKTVRRIFSVRNLTKLFRVCCTVQSPPEEEIPPQKIRRRVRVPLLRCCPCHDEPFLGYRIRMRRQSTFNTNCSFEELEAKVQQLRERIPTARSCYTKKAYLNGVNRVVLTVLHPINSVKETEPEETEPEESEPEETDPEESEPEETDPEESAKEFVRASIQRTRYSNQKTLDYRTMINEYYQKRTPPKICGDC